MKRIPVDLWSDAPSAVEATDSTIRQLPGGLGVAREGNRWVVECDDRAEGFVRFAIEQQGYVKRVLP